MELVARVKFVDGTASQFYQIASVDFMQTRC